MSKFTPTDWSGVGDLHQRIDALQDENTRLRALITTPEASDDERYEDSEDYAETLEWLIDLGVEKVAAKMSLDGIIRRVRRGPAPADAPSERVLVTHPHDGHALNETCHRCIASHPTPPEDVAVVTDAMVDAAGATLYSQWNDFDSEDEMATAIHELVCSAIAAALAAVPADGETESERWFRAGWEESGEGYNGEYPDEGVPWHKSEGRKAYLRLTAPIPEGSAD